MKKLALVFIAMLFVIPAAAQFYSSGPTNGNTDAWTINFGFITSDRFYLQENDSTLTGAQFAMWLFSGDTLTSAELSITSGENSGTSYFDQTVNFTQGACTANQYGTMSARRTLRSAARRSTAVPTGSICRTPACPPAIRCTGTRTPEALTRGRQGHVLVPVRISRMKRAAALVRRRQDSPRLHHS